MGAVRRGRRRIWGGDEAHIKKNRWCIFGRHLGLACETACKFASTISLGLVPGIVSTSIPVLSIEGKDSYRGTRIAAACTRTPRWSFKPRNFVPGKRMRSDVFCLGAELTNCQPYPNASPYNENVLPAGFTCQAARFRKRAPSNFQLTTDLCIGSFPDASLGLNDGPGIRTAGTQVPWSDLGMGREEERKKTVGTNVYPGNPLKTHTMGVEKNVVGVRAEQTPRSMN